MFRDKRPIKTNMNVPNERNKWDMERCKILIQHCLDSRFSSRYLVISINIGITYFSFSKTLFSWKYISLYSSFFHRFFLSLCNK